MQKRKHLLVLGLVAVLAVVLLNLPAGAAARLKLALGSLFLPLFGLAGATGHTAGKLGDAVTPRSDLVRELETLRRENGELKVRVAEKEAIERENARLRDQLAWATQSGWKLRPARVIARDPANWWRTVFIDAGSHHGVAPDMPVLTSDGLVGRVASVGLLRSQVVLLGDPACRVAAMVKESGENGFVSPMPAHLADNRFVVLNYLTRAAAPKAGQAVVSSGVELKPGQTVLSSGQGGVFPNGLLIGQVVDTRTVGHGLYTEARVQLAVNLNAIEEVWVLLQ
jgi:rod shape-determining protein MreC